MRPSIICLAALHGIASVAADPECVKGLYLLVARGTEEEKGAGVLEIVAKDIAKKIDDSKVVPIVYPAKAIVPTYSDSVAKGAMAVHDNITEYAKACPQSKIAYLGYSQGAQIASEAMCGPSNPLTLSNKVVIPIKTILNSVIAIALFGDPTHMTGTSYDRGTSQHNGLFARHDAGNCKSYENRMASWCDTGDYFCDSGHNDTVHGTYVQRYGKDMTDFVVNQFHNKDSLNDGTNQSSVTSASASASGTAAPTSVSGSGTKTESASGSATATDGQPSTTSSATSSASRLAGMSVAWVALVSLLM